jgi:hypothetical protein
MGGGVSKKTDPGVITRGLGDHPGGAKIPITTNQDELAKAGEAVNPVTKKQLPRDPVARLNQSKALAAEVAARDWVKAAYGARAKLRGILQRPNGVPVFDFVFQTGENEFLLVEAKSYYSELGFTGDRVMVAGTAGPATPVKLADEVEQLSGRWLEQRIDELGNSKYADDASKVLGKELNRSWRAGRTRVLLVRAPPNQLSTDVVFEVVDYTDEANAHVGATARHDVPKGSEVGSRFAGAPVKKGVSTPGRTPEVRSLATHEALLKGELKEAQKTSTALANKARAVEARVATARKGLAAAQERANDLGGGPKAVADRKASVETWKTKLAQVEGEAGAAKDLVATAAEKEAKLTARVRTTQGEIARLQALQPTLPVRPPPGAPVRPPPGAPPRATRIPPERQLTAGEPTHTPPTKVEPPPPPPIKQSGTLVEVRPSDAQAQRIERGLASTGVTPHTSGSVAASAAGSAAKEERALTTIVHAGEAAGKVGKLAKVLSLTKTLGKVAVGFFIPLTALEVALQLAIWLLEWDQHRRHADEEEWQRIMTFLFDVQEVVPDPFAGTYAPTMGQYFWPTVETLLQSPADPNNNIVHWIEQWNDEPKWLGFVYAKASGLVIRNEHTPGGWGAPKAPRPIRYYAGGLRPSLMEFSSTVGRYKTQVGDAKVLEAQNNENLFSGGSHGDPSTRGTGDRTDYLALTVTATRYNVGAICPTPSLTPFDYLVFKCRDLLAEIVRFISKFDENFLVVPPFDNTNAFVTINWYEGLEFPKPIDSTSAHFCLKALFLLQQALETHGRARESAQWGFERRLALVQLIYKPNLYKRPMYEMAKRLQFLASDLDYTRYRRNQDPELAYLTNESLFALAIEIENDAKRIYEAMIDPKRSYQYRYLGSMEVD